MRRGRRKHLAEPLRVISGKVILLVDFVVDPRRGEGFMIDEIDAADLPEDVMYYARNVKTGQTMWVTPKARENNARYQMNNATTPNWKADQSYFWQDEARRVKEEADV